jgi:hypothetical protein
MSVDVHPRSAERLQFTRPAHRLIVWMLWKEKNGRVFEHAAVTDPTLFTKISDETTHGKATKHCCALPFAVCEAAAHDTPVFALRIGLCHSQYAIFIFFNFCCIYLNTYIYSLIFF